MNSLNLDKYLDIANEEKIKRGLENYIPLYPMLRNCDGKLYICVVLTEENDKVWELSGNVKPEYWILIDAQNDSIVEFNKTEERDLEKINTLLSNIIDCYSHSTLIMFKEFSELLKAHKQEIINSFIYITDNNS